ncbi:hypothetical protein BG015_011208 [Linnemannia schmuckeri]|uniref:Methyltransferase type 11 domain-containing protein n=1 Tax=Linnemannia schmuckeri TaxID=64567 RepID=A0A9P5V8I9_9FUNG|nr:hypothetical protein BG015_011208 [Linnemannia schmuckeri]
MGAQPSKLNKVLSRSTTESSISQKDKHRREQHKQAQKDLTGVIITPIAAYPLNTPLVGKSDDLHSYSYSDQNESDLTGDATPGGGGTRTESAVSSKTNLSSFLSSIRSKNKDPVDPEARIDAAGEKKTGSTTTIDDLWEQKQQKKINKQNEKAKAKAKKQLQQQQQQQQSLNPYQQQTSASTFISSPDGQHQRAPSSQSKTARISPSAPTSPTLPPQSTFHTPISNTSMSSLGQHGPPSSQSATSFQPTVSALGMFNLSSESDPSPTHSKGSEQMHSSISSPGLGPSTTAPSLSAARDISPQTRPSKLSFIRGKAGFAWLEKKLPPASSALDDEVLKNDAWSYRHGQLLNEMEAEAAKGYVDRITDQHYLMKDIMGGNFHAPIDLAFKRVLENGCGAGDWTVDMASEMPETDFVACPQIVFTTSNAEKSTPLLRPRGLLGADQSQMGSIGPATSSLNSSTAGSPSAASAPTGVNIRPTLRPRNCTFVPDVPLNRLPFTNEQFDFVYQRRQSVVLMSTEWQRTILELFRVLKRGGWVQILEPDLHLRGGGDLCQLAGEYCVRIFEAVGRNPNVIHEMQHLLESAGFVNVALKVFSIPLGWGGVIGQAMLVNQRQFVNELEPIYVRQGHGRSEEYRELTRSIFEEAVEKHAYINYHVIVAQKPASASDRALHQQQLRQQELNPD